MYLRRSSAPKTWPIPRKGKKYLVVPSHSKKSAIPLLIVLRDVLRSVKNRGEAKQIIHLKKVKINNKIVKDEKQALLIFDKLEVGEEIYQIMINENKKFEARKVKNLDKKTAKIIGKKVMKKGKVQANLNDGRNFIVKENLKIGDSAVIDLAENKIEKIIPLRENTEVFVIGGKHLGKQGKIEKITGELAEVKTAREKINVNLKNLMAV